MDSSLIGKIEKAKRYADEQERFQFNNFSVTINGTNNPHSIHYDKGTWSCDCSFFQTRGRCSHTMALEIILEGMVDVGETVQG